MKTDSNLHDLPDTQMSCPTHGAFISTGRKLAIGRLTREMWSSCPQCKAHSTTQACLSSAERSATLEQERLATALQQAAVPKRFMLSSFDNFELTSDEQRRAHTRCQRYAENFERHLDQGTGLILAGKPGTGKSHLACAILKAIMPTHVGAYTTLMDLVHLLREGWSGKGARSEKSILAELGGLPLLVIDEIGVQYGTAAEQLHLFEVMDRRHRDMKPTILITNQNKDGFKGFIGERIGDRLADTATWVQCDWPSHRGSARQAAAARA